MNVFQKLFIIAFLLIALAACKSESEPVIPDGFVGPSSAPHANLGPDGGPN